MNPLSSSALPVTVAIPVKNEEVNLARCLKRLGRFAEIVVIDSGSTDRTAEIAEEFGACVVDFRWNGKYPKKRNWFLLNAPPTQPWVLFLDADEFVDEAFCEALAGAVTVDDINGYWLCYRNYFLGKPLRHGLAQRKLALFRVGAALYEKIDEEFWSPLDMESTNTLLSKARPEKSPCPLSIGMTKVYASSSKNTATMRFGKRGAMPGCNAPLAPGHASPRASASSTDTLRSGGIRGSTSFSVTWQSSDFSTAGRVCTMRPTKPGIFKPSAC